MNKFTVRHAHLYKKSPLQEGQIITYGQLIGIMGSSGQSKHNHLHTDCIHGHINKIVRLKDIVDDREDSNKKYKSNEKQLMYFIDEDLFKIKPHITTTYMEDEYKILFNKDHPAIDCVPIDRHKTNEHYSIYWNRSKPGTVLKTGFDKNGYGYYILIGFEI